MKNLQTSDIEYIVEYTLNKAADKAKWVAISDYAADRLNSEDCCVDRESILQLKNNIIKYLKKQFKNE